MKTAERIARRYLFRTKSQGVVSRISWISVAAMALGCAALIIILSVYNGFDRIIRDNIDSTTPDYVIRPTQGKTFRAEASLRDSIAALPGVEALIGTVEERVAVNYDERQGIALMRGIEGAWQCSVSTKLASELGIRTQFLSRLELWYPSRLESFSMRDPAASLERISSRPRQIFNSDEAEVIVPIDKARQLLHLDSLSISSLEVYAPQLSSRRLKQTLPDGFEVLDRYQQHSALYKMMRYEKMAIFAILLFIIVIISFNIFGAMRMLIVEKQEDIATLRSIGADKKLVKKVFFLEGWGITLLGLVAGLVAGVTLVLIQQSTGFIKMPGNFVASSYPVALQVSDLLLTSVVVSALGAFIAVLSSRKLK